MKISLSLVGAQTLSLLLFSNSEAVAQQARVYNYQQFSGYPQPQYGSQAPVYSQAPRYSAPTGYAQPSYPQANTSQYVSPAEFLPTFGRKFGSMFRRVFYGDANPSPYYQSPQQGYAPAGRLDQPPQGYAQPQRLVQPAPITPPRYELPPPAKSGPSSTLKTANAPKPTSSEGSKTATSSGKKSSTKLSQGSNSSSRKYTPPSITREATRSKTRLEEEPPPVVEKENPSSNPPSQLPGFKPKEETKSSSSSTAAANTGNFLRGKKGSKEGRVISPYPPYRELDVTALSSGSLALDPTTQKVFEVP